MSIAVDTSAPSVERSSLLPMLTLKQQLLLFQRVSAEDLCYAIGHNAWSPTVSSAVACNQEHRLPAATL